MTTQTTVSSEGLLDFIEDGDVLINFTANLLECSLPFVSCSLDGEAKVATDQPSPVAGEIKIAAVAALQSDRAKRFVVLSDGSPQAREFADQLSAAGVATASFVLAEDCAADSFMDEDDAEAVAERLRQLGYI